MKKAIPPYKKATLKPLSDFQVEEGFNKRRDFAITDVEVARLKKTYDEDPYNIPAVTGYKSGSSIVITDGERRLRLAQAAGIPTLPFIPTSNDPLARLESQAVRNSGKPFTDVENADLSVALTASYIAANPGAKKEEVREYVMGVMNISQPTFYNYEKLQQALPEVQDLVTAGKIAATRVREIMTETKDQDAVLAQVQEDIADAEAQATESGSTKPAKATRSSAKKAMKKKAAKTPFSEKSYQVKLKEVLEEIIDSPAAGSQFLIQLDAALKGTSSKAEILAIVVEANLSPAE
jgi:ParB-like chromosome segregation protein Spo0J